jgi:hypothetical protein
MVIRYLIATNSQILDKSANKNEIIRAFVAKMVYKRLPCHCAEDKL